MVHLLQRLRSNKNKWKLLFRWRSSPGERHRGAFVFIILPPFTRK
jgi:hypothetical protein